MPLEALPPWQSPEGRQATAIALRGRILTADPQAAAAGVLPGQKLSTALGLQPKLRVFERDMQRESCALHELACWAGRFTPTLSLAPPAGLLLEIGGCRRLFGGVPAIVESVLAGCRAQGWSVDWAVAPTPLAARWLAQSAAGACIDSPDGLTPALAKLSCQRIDWPVAVRQRLESFGFRQLGDLLAQPMAVLRRRIGNDPVDALLRAQGELPDPQSLFVFPERFSTRLDLPSRVEFAEGLAFAAQRLFAALAGWLHARQRLLHDCMLRLIHEAGAPSELLLRFGEPCADESRFLRLLREHLGRLQLAAPVEGLQLDAGQVIERPGSSEALFEHAPAGEGALACIARLRARLGEGAVWVPVLAADYRPECATRAVDPASVPALGSTSTAAKAGVLAGVRPLWLLPVPQPLAERPDGPHWRGPLQLLTRAERLESGWWDSAELDAGGLSNAPGDIRRDYFVARNGQGQWVWIFRDAQGWYLQGAFA